mmetsp:Transcript_5182/g.12129  ORF Transcript_5182/g.12129 Transcript_5182/m.12129 type:complete len:240 (+) Transcript_5182:2088-2807(+)
MLVLTPVITVGPMKLPSGCSGTDTFLPSKAIVAPSSLADSMRSPTLCLAAREISGPMSALGSKPPETFKFFAFATNSSTSPLADPTRTSVLRAIQRCPAAPNAAPTKALTACVGSASGMITPWFFAAMLIWQRLPCALPLFQICSPALLDPTKEMDLMSGLSQMKLTASCPPWMIFTTPGGSPAFSMSSTSRCVAPGTRSDGFMIMELPQTAASGNIQRGIIAGKLKGAIPAVTPRGTR